MTIFSAYAKCADAGALGSYLVSDCGHILIRNMSDLIQRSFKLESLIYGFVLYQSTR